MSYESPIELIMGQMNLVLEDQICRAVQNVGVNVDKEELLKALQYDRGQYQKGYRDRDTEIVRCEECCHWKPPHIVLNDGRQRSYVKGDKDNDPFGIGVSNDVGLNVGGKCWVDHNCGYGRDMRVFRQKNDYCSRAVKLPEGTTAEEYWGLSEEPAELRSDFD